MGISPDGFRARQLDVPEAREADLVLTADKAVRSRVLEDIPRALNRTFTIRELAALVGAEASSECVRTGPTDLVKRAASRRGAVAMEGYDLPDPIGQSADVHLQVAGLIDQDCSAIARAVAKAVRCGVQRAAE